MYLSKFKIKVDIGSKTAINDILNGHDLHRSIQSMFNASRKDACILYTRAFNRYDVNKMFVYVLSETKPVCNDEHFELIYTREQSTDFDEGKRLTFQIECNPTKRLGKNRYFIRSSDERLNWLQRKAEQYGFLVLDCTETAQNGVAVKKKEHSFTFPSVVFRGSLVVTDKSKFANAIKNGIGAEKAYGMGMLMVV